MEGKGMREHGGEDQLWERHLPLGLRAAPGVTSGPWEGGHQASQHDRSCREHVPGGGGIPGRPGGQTGQGKLRLQEQGHRQPRCRAVSPQAREGEGRRGDLDPPMGRGWLPKVAPDSAHCSQLLCLLFITTLETRHQGPGLQIKKLRLNETLCPGGLQGRCGWGQPWAASRQALSPQPARAVSQLEGAGRAAHGSNSRPTRTGLFR